MRYLLAVFLPPASVLLCRQPRQLVVNVLLTACLWLPGVAHALLVARDTSRRERSDRLAAAVLAREERLVLERRRARMPHVAARLARTRA
jgi:uncharacterized membrane protein YqaE (UPF0057 family)